MVGNGTHGVQQSDKSIMMFRVACTSFDVPSMYRMVAALCDFFYFVLRKESAGRILHSYRIMKS